jgi:hypothetical protein
MIRRILLLMAAAAGLSACATGPSLTSQMASYTGVTSEQLVQKLGVPDKQITAGGTQYLAYTVRQLSELGPSPWIGGGFGDGFYGRGFYGGGLYASDLPRPIDNWSCESTFALKNDHVVGFTLRGNDCS